LPSLISSLNARVGAVLRLGVDARDWDDIPRRIIAGGRRVRVGWFADLDHKIIVTRGPQDHIFLLVVPPHASTIAARSALAMASIGKHSSAPEEILIASGIQHDGKANPFRANRDDDHHPRERTPRTAALDAVPPVSEDAPPEETGQVDRWLDDGAPPLAPRHSTGTDPPAEQAQPPPEQGCPQPADRSAPERGAATSSTTKFETRAAGLEALPGGRIIAIYADGHSLDLLTVPPHTDRNSAWTAMEQAIRIPGISASVAMPAPEIRWESEGGQSQARAAGV
jgi:Family of unknown function (DUF5994)